MPQEHTPTYSQILSPSKYIELMRQHVYITAVDQLIAEMVQFYTYNRYPFPLEIVEVGCGPAEGRLTPLLLQEGTRVTAIDHDPGFLDHAISFAQRENLPIRFVNADVALYRHGAPYPVDIYVSQGVHHHIAKGQTVQQYLENIRNQLQPGGFYILSDEFLPFYRDEAERRIRAVIWYAHVIGWAQKSGHHELALAEAETLLDDLNEGELKPRFKNGQQVGQVLADVSKIFAVSQQHDLFRAETLAKELLSTIDNLTEVTVQDDPPTTTLSRGDYKICHRIFAREVTEAGFKIESIVTKGPMHNIGGFSVYALRA